MEQVELSKRTTKTAAALQLFCLFPELNLSGKLPTFPPERCEACGQTRGECFHQPTGDPDLVMVEHSEDLHRLSLTVELQQARDGFRGG